MTGIGSVRPALAPAGIAALATAAILARQREFGPAFPWDAVNYVCAARNLLAGNGLIECHGDPMTAWAPLYPALLALASLPGFDPREVAGPLGAAFFGAFVFVVGLWLRANLESRFLALWGCLAAALSIPLTRMFSSAMSEPPFLLFAALALICADRRLEDGRAAPLAWAAAFAALAWATRFAGIAVVAVVALALSLERRSALDRKARNIWLYASISAAPIGVWMAWNFVEEGSPPPPPPPREVDYSLSEAVTGIARAVGGWALHDSSPHGAAIGGGVLLLLAAGAGCLGAQVLPRIARRRERAFLLFGGFALAYVAFYAWTTVSGRTWHGVQPRHLLPIYVPILFAALLAADRIAGAVRRLDGRRRRAWGRAAALAPAAALVLWLSLGAYPQIRGTLRGEPPHALEYGGPRWTGSEVVRYLRDSPPDGVVWANDDFPLHFLVGGTSRYAHLPLQEQVGVTVDGGWSETLAEWLHRRARSRDLVVWFRGLEEVDRLYHFDASDVYALPEASLLAVLEDGLVFRIDKGADGRRSLSAPSSAPFDVRLRAWGGHARLVVVERRCGAGGGAPFFLRVWPVRGADLSAGRRERGFDELGFDFERNRARYGSICVASAALPDYAAARVQIGQRADGGPLWRTEFYPQRGAREILPPP